DDASTDGSNALISKFPVKLIRLKKNMGSGNARNVGMLQSSGDLVIFIDADVVVQSDSFPLLLRSFQDDLTLDAVIGCFSVEHPNRNFFSQYKNLYMHYIFCQMPDHVDFLFTSICALKRTTWLNFMKTRLKTDDTELGQRYSAGGRKIMLHKSINVVHLKRHTFVSFFKNEFLIPRDWAVIFLRNQGFAQLVRKRRFAHAKGNQIIGILIVLLIPMIVALWGVGSFMAVLLCLGVFFSLQARFLAFLYRSRGLLFLVTSVFVVCADAFVMGMGVIAGTCAYLFIPKEFFEQDSNHVPQKQPEALGI
nr:glycosyltransferase [Candidatus Omnitrophota bacterium]